MSALPRLVFKKGCIVETPEEYAWSHTAAAATTTAAAAATAATTAAAAASIAAASTAARFCLQTPLYSQRLGTYILWQNLLRKNPPSKLYDKDFTHLQRELYGSTKDGSRCTTSSRKPSILKWTLFKVFPWIWIKILLSTLPRGIWWYWTTSCLRQPRIPKSTNCLRKAVTIEIYPW